MTFADDFSHPHLTPDHRLNQGRLRVAELSSHVALRAPELAARLCISRASAYRLIERLAGSQHREEALRLGTTVAPIGSGAKRQVLAVLWPVEAPP